MNRTAACADGGSHQRLSCCRKRSSSTRKRRGVRAGLLPLAFAAAGFFYQLPQSDESDEFVSMVVVLVAMMAHSSRDAGRLRRAAASQAVKTAASKSSTTIEQQIERAFRMTQRDGTYPSRISSGNKRRMIRPRRGLVGRTPLLRINGSTAGRHLPGVASGTRPSDDQPPRSMERGCRPRSACVEALLKMQGYGAPRRLVAIVAGCCSCCNATGPNSGCAVSTRSAPRRGASGIHLSSPRFLELPPAAIQRGAPPTRQHPISPQLTLSVSF